MLLSTLIVQRVGDAYQSHIRDLSREKLLIEQGAVRNELRRCPGAPALLLKLAIVSSRLRPT
jgi:hypothetical protein